MNNVNLIVKKMLKSKINKENYYLAYLQVHWQDLVGEKIAQKTQPDMLKSNTLFLNTTSSAWANNLLIIKNDIIDKLNSIIDFKLKDIKTFVVAKLISYKQEDLQEQQKLLSNLSQLEEKKIREDLQNVKDDDLYQKLFCVIYKDIQKKNFCLKEKFEKCQICGVQLVKKDVKLCFVCMYEQKQEFKALVMKMIFDTPFISFEQVKEEFSITKEKFLSIRKECLQILFNKINIKNPSKNDVTRYLMLKNNCDLSSLTDDIVENTIKKIRRRNNVSSFRNGYNG